MNTTDQPCTRCGLPPTAHPTECPPNLPLDPNRTQQQTFTHQPGTSPVAAVSMRLPVPHGRQGNHRHTSRRTGIVCEVLGYGRGEHDGLVTVRVDMVPYTDSRTVTVLAEDIRFGPTPLDAMGAAAWWGYEKDRSHGTEG